MIERTFKLLPWQLFTSDTSEQIVLISFDDAAQYWWVLFLRPYARRTQIRESDLRQTWHYSGDMGT